MPRPSGLPALALLLATTVATTLAPPLQAAPGRRARPASSAAAAEAPSAAQAGTRRGGAAAAPGAAEAIRLPAAVRPQAAQLSLTLDPAQPRYSGQVLYDLRIDRATAPAAPAAATATAAATGSTTAAAAPAPHHPDAAWWPDPARDLVLHARGLRIDAAWAEVGAQKLAAQVQVVDRERVLLRFARPLGGSLRIGLQFSGSVAAAGTDGLLRLREGSQRPGSPGERWMLVTNLEPHHARSVFPCFDEPGFKLPWRLALTVPEGEDALANAPLAAAPGSPHGDALPPPAPPRPGWKTLHFAPTPPLPSYLLAFAVGRFALREAGQVGELPLRIATQPGREADAAVAAALGAPLVQRLEAYFDMPLPFAKLDALSVPAGRGFGAMENPGLVTYHSGLLLAAPGQDNPVWRQHLLGTMAHELAHQWFGNLVTPAWWDDLWLNESFASWLGDRTAQQLDPAGDWALSALDARRQAMHTDRLPGARAVQQPLRRDEDFGDLWNAITYDKGQALLAMTEAWLGEAPMRDAVRRFIGRHAWGNASRADFLAALGEQDAALPPLLDALIRLPGIPLLQATLHCPADGPPRLRLDTRRLLPRGVPAAAAAAAATQRYPLPLRLRSPAGETRLLLPPEGADLALPDPGCPAWLQANADGAGYYRVAYRGALGTPAAAGSAEAAAAAATDAATTAATPTTATTAATAGAPHATRPPLPAGLADAPAGPDPLTDRHLLRLAARPDLPRAERVALLDDAAGLLEAGLLSADAAWALVQQHAAVDDPALLRRALQLLQALDGPRLRALPAAPGGEAAAAAEATRQAVAQRWQQAFGARARALGWMPQPGEDPQAGGLRLQLVPAMAQAGRDATLQAQARARVQAWLAGGAAGAPGATGPTGPAAQEAPPAAPPAALPPGPLRAALLVTALHDADAALFDALLAAWRATARPDERQLLMAGLAAFRAPALAARARALLLEPDAEVSAMLPVLLTQQAAASATRPGLLAWLAQQLPKLAARASDADVAGWPEALAAGCSEADARQTEAVFAREAARRPGGRVALAAALQSIAICQAQQAPLAPLAQQAPQAPQRP